MAVQLDPVLLEVLACPDTHHAPLTVGTPDDPDADALTCTECGRVFEVRGGIPVLLLSDDDDDTAGTDGTAGTAGATSIDAAATADPADRVEPGDPADQVARPAEPGTRP